MGHGEINWLNFDRTVRHYAAASAHVENLGELARQITAFCGELNHRRPTMMDLSHFLAPSPGEAIESGRVAAWMAQNVLGGRVWSVGQKVAMTRKSSRCSSPLAQQIEALGMGPAIRGAINDRPRWLPHHLLKQDKLDAMSVDLHKRRVYLVKAQSWTVAKKLSSSVTLLKAADRETLFGSADAVFGGVMVRTDALATVLYARRMLCEAFPSVEFVACFLTYEDLDGRGRFQLQDVSSLDLERLTDQKTSIDGYRTVATHEGFADALKENPEALLGLPKSADADWLRKAPVDLPVRAIMLLRTIGEQQRSTEKRLALLPAAELASRVSKEYGIHYPKDMWRHDILRLQRATLIADAPNGSKTIGLTACGLARLLIVEHRFNPMLPRPVSFILETLTEQENRWVSAGSI